MILLPGGSEQIKYFLNHYNPADKRILFVGTGTVEAAKELLNKLKAKIDVIVEDHESLIASRLAGSKHAEINSRLMNFEYTDFADGEFDAVYAQASISDIRRNKIVKEIKRILKPDGVLSVVELVKLTEQPPKFVTDIWAGSDIKPIHIDKLKAYYEQQGFEVFWDKDLTHTLKQFYSEYEELLDKNIDKLKDNEKSYYKTVLNKISHESNVYLKLGGAAHMGIMLIMARRK